MASRPTQYLYANPGRNRHRRVEFQWAWRNWLLRMQNRPAGGTSVPRGSIPAASTAYLSDQTANSLPSGSRKWNRRPPGNAKISLVIFPFDLRIFASFSSSTAS